MAAVQPVSLSSFPRFQLKHILVATDFSECSQHALKQSVAIARLHSSDLLVLHVIPPQPMIENALEPPSWELDDVRHQAKSQMASAEIVEILTGIQHQMLVEHGYLQEILAKLIREREISLVVVGTHGRSGFRKLLLGSVAEEIFRATECAVMTISPGEPPALLTQGRFQSVLFATDFSQGSMHALPYAIGFAQESRARLTVLHVAEQSSVTALYMNERLIAESKERLIKIIAAQEGLTVTPEIDVTGGFPIDEILHMAEHKKADLIVMGVHKLHGLGARASAHLPWTIAQTIVCRAKCPVLTVRG